MLDIVNKINKKYVAISNKVTRKYEKVFSLPCDIYLPIFNKYTNEEKYENMKIFSPHQSCTYKEVADYKDVPFYIPYLIKGSSMNSSEVEYDSFFPEDEIDRPFIETSKKRELPTQTKVVVKQGSSIIKFFVDRKRVVTGADGFMLLRMYLSPLAKDMEGEIPEQEETVGTTDKIIDVANTELEMEIPDDED